MVDRGTMMKINLQIFPTQLDHPLIITGPSASPYFKFEICASCQDHGQRLCMSWLHVWLTRTYIVKICHQNVVKHCISFYILCHYLLSFTSCWVIICRYLMNYWWLSDFVVWFKLNSVSNIQNLGVKAAFILTLMFIIFRNLQLEWNWIMDGQ